MLPSDRRAPGLRRLRAGAYRWVPSTLTLFLAWILTPAPVAYRHVHPGAGAWHVHQRGDETPSARVESPTGVGRSRSLQATLPADRESGGLWANPDSRHWHAATLLLPTLGAVCIRPLAATVQIRRRQPATADRAAAGGLRRLRARGPPNAADDLHQG